MSSCCLRLWGPDIALPVGGTCRRSIAHAFPPHVTIRSERCVCVQAVAPQCVHSVCVGVVTSSRCNAEESGFWVNGIETSIVTKLHPANVVTDCFGLPAWNRRNEHRKVCLAACRRERSSDVLRCAFWVCELQDEHVFCKPACIACHHRSDAKCEALLAEQGVAAVARTERPDLTSLREVNDELVVGVAWPCRTCLTWSQWVTNGVNTRNPFVVAENIKCTLAHASHDAHADCYVCAIGELHTNVCDGGAKWSHGERHDVHRATLHCALVQGVHLCAHL
ncbi:unannotated protein [freshwater metagenome]|uniref:Unannotated protein n=1 Tax=freshwater metagenome TaxID=449393 RepID=A0A6J6MSP7_9ZZZZ